MLPRDYGGFCIQMRLHYSPFAPFLLHLIEWMDFSCTDPLPSFLGRFHILLYKVLPSSIAAYLIFISQSLVKVSFLRLIVFSCLKKSKAPSMFTQVCRCTSMENRWCRQEKEKPPSGSSMVCTYLLTFAFSEMNRLVFNSFYCENPGSCNIPFTQTTSERACRGKRRDFV